MGYVQWTVCLVGARDNVLYCTKYMAGCLSSSALGKWTQYSLGMSAQRDASYCL